MRLHENKDEFGEMITLTAQEKHIPESAVERDYYIVQALQFLSNSENAGHIYDNTDKPLKKMINEMELNDYKIL